MVYLFCMKDVASREIVAYEVISIHGMKISYHNLEKLADVVDGNDER